ncbi:sialate O-acetylesterase [Flavihumibacter rivuli]|uniref:sialate O-acetylesterase n=1 Tax=Flavihumibacter rivuli TaxID=2838156 RepID=UPI001BDE5DC3|nr:sialate O-acetylesterase [Flavihumibacter rivuli]ULQ58302.1 sialate O-acetylesterase [Flavihumibacter rivuli]
MKRFAIVLFCSLLVTGSAWSQLRLPAILSSGMVLQQKDSVTLWGWSGSGEKVYVTTGWDNRKDSTISTNMATWRLKVKTPAAGGPYTITITSRNTIVLEDVMIGEVWVCSGQSNMEWSYYNGTSDIQPEFATAFNRNIRFFHVPRTASYHPQDDLKASWAVCDSNTIKSFSSVGYFFGKNLQQNLHVPIGLINASWGGTPAETWTPGEVVEGDPQLKAAAAQLPTFAWWPSATAQAFNGMIAPLANFRIAGAIWYQGESNVSTSSTYTRLFTRMVDAWRKAFNNEFPFYYVQIAPFAYENHNVGALLREAQTRAMQHPKTGMVVITDLVDTVSDIHPGKKAPVGKRLANWALAETYGQTGIHYQSPEFANMVREKDKLAISFSHIGSGLVINGRKAEGFYICGPDRQWYAAEAKLDKDRILVWSKQVKDPEQVRYGFSNTLIGNIATKEGLPLTPFRTDNFEVDQSPVK